MEELSIKSGLLLFSKDLCILKYLGQPKQPQS